jgi:hypothetical protein
MDAWNNSSFSARSIANSLIGSIHHARSMHQRSVNDVVWCELPRAPKSQAVFVNEKAPFRQTDSVIACKL